MSVRKAHNSGRNHERNVLDYYQSPSSLPMTPIPSPPTLQCHPTPMLQNIPTQSLNPTFPEIGHEKAQSVIDSITSSYAAEGQAGANPMLGPQGGGGPMGGQPFPPPPFGFPGGLPPPPFGLPSGPNGAPAGFIPPPIPGRGMPFPPFPPPGGPGPGGQMPGLPAGLPFPPPDFRMPPQGGFPPPPVPPLQQQGQQQQQQQGQQPPSAMSPPQSGGPSFLPGMGGGPGFGAGGGDRR